MPLTTFDASQTNYLTNLLKGRRPALKYVSASTVEVELGTYTGSTSAAEILFPDGDLRSTTSTTRYRGDITRVYSQTQSGLRSGSELSDTWYSCFAVKTTVDWVMVFDPIPMSSGNIATINGYYGVNSWVYLGIIRNGNVAGVVNDIVDFHMTGNRTQFRNMSYISAASGRNAIGIRYAAASGVTSQTYTYTPGMSSLEVPSQIGYVLWYVSHAQITRELMTGTSAFNPASGTSTIYSCVVSTGLGSTSNQIWLPAADGVGYGNSGGATGNGTIILQGWVDNALSPTVSII